MNTAARLESFDKDLFAPDPDGNPCRILIGETTRRYLGDRFETEPIGDVSLKGKTQTVGIYRLIGRAAGRSAPSAQEEDDENRSDARRGRDGPRGRAAPERRATAGADAGEADSAAGVRGVASSDRPAGL